MLPDIDEELRICDPPEVFKTVLVAFSTRFTSESCVSGNDIEFSFPGTIAEDMYHYQVVPH